MKRPKMILFDYGQTLINESYFDGVKGTAAVMKYAVKNKYEKTPEQIQREAESINREIRKVEPLFQIEIPFCQIDAWYIGNRYEYDIVRAENAGFFLLKNFLPAFKNVFITRCKLWKLIYGRI